MARRGDFRQVDISILLRLPRKSPVQRVAHVLDLTLLRRATIPSGTTISSCHVSVAGNLDKQALVLACIQHTCTVAPSNERQTEITSWRYLGREDSMARERRSAVITAGYGPDPDVFDPALLGTSMLVPPAPAYLHSSERGMMIMPPA